MAIVYNYNDVVTIYKREEQRNNKTGSFSINYVEYQSIKADVKVSGQGEKETNFAELNTSKLQVICWRMPDVNDGDVIKYNDNYFNIDGIIFNDKSKLTELYNCTKLKEKPTNLNG